MAVDLRSQLHNIFQPTSHALSGTVDGEARNAGVRRLIEDGARTPSIAILGAGAAGLCMAIQLLEPVSYTHLTLPTNREV